MRTSIILALSGFLALASACIAQTGPPPSASKAPSDVLEFTNGDKLTGKLERAVGGNVVFKSDMAGELTIPFSKVKTLQSGSKFVALKAGKPGEIKPVGSGAVAFEGDNLTLTPANGQPQTLPAKELGFLIDVPSYAKEVDHRASFRQGWTGAATAGLTLVRSTQTDTTFTGALNFVRAIPTVAYLPNRNRTTINLTESYGTNTSPVIPQTTPPSPAVTVKTSIFHADAERDEYFTPRLFALGDVAFDHNFAQGLQLQQVYGLGAGWTAIQDARQELDLRGDVHYEKQQFIASTASQTSLDLVGSTFQENYHRTLPRKLVFTEWANYLPSWNDTHAYSANAYISLTMPVFKRLGATVSATDNFLNDPSPGYRRNSVLFVAGLTYTFQ